MRKQYETEEGIITSYEAIDEATNLCYNNPVYV